MRALLPLCSTPAVQMRDGYAGVNAKLLIPFVGWWYANGATYTYPNSTIPQAVGMRMGGLRMIDNYAKDCCDCSSCNQGGVTERAA